MDSKFRSSFIPKASFEKEVGERQGFGFFGALSILAFILSVVFTGGSFLYKTILKSEVSNLKSQTSSALLEIDKKSVNEIISFDRQLNSVKDILAGHVTISKFFEMLEKETVSQIQFLNLNYSALPGNNISVVINGKAKSYAAIALQEDVFLQDPNTISVSFNNMQADEKSGVVSFSLKGEFKNDLVKFKIPEEIVLPGLDSQDKNLDVNNI